MITPEQLEHTFKEVREYEKINFGIRFGEDFPTIAGLLSKSKSFRDMHIAAAALGLMHALVVSSEKKSNPTADPTEILEKGSPFKEIMAEMFYAGYKLGRQVAEVDALENLNK